MSERKINSLSIVLPAYRQEKTILDDIKQLDRYLSTLSLPYEILIVFDGLEDATFTEAKKYTKKHIKHFVIPQNVGKGYAVRYGMLQATSDVVGFIDAGMDLDRSGIGLLLDYMELLDADIIIGSKLHPDSVVTYPVQRRILSRGYRFMTRVMFGFAVRDTQVGLKLFRREVVEAVFPLLVVKRFAFDVEVLAVAYSLGFTKIYEAPVKLTFNWGSTIKNFTSQSFWKVIYSMLWDTAAVFYRLKILHFYDHQRANSVPKTTKRTPAKRKKK